MAHRNFQSLAVLLSILLLTPQFGLAQEESAIRIKVLAGEAGINNINQNVVVEPMIEIQDANGKPIPKATVTLRSPATGPSVTFFGASRVSTLTTDDQGRVRAAGMLPNSEEGTFNIEVEAAYNNMTSATTITQTNAVAPGDPKPKKKGRRLETAGGHRRRGRRRHRCRGATRRNRYGVADQRRRGLGERRRTALAAWTASTNEHERYQPCEGSRQQLHPLFLGQFSLPRCTPNSRSRSKMRTCFASSAAPGTR